MPIEQEYQEVYFGAFCKMCKHWVEGDEQKEPCFECLENPINLYTSRPVKYEPKEK